MDVLISQQLAGQIPQAQQLRLQELLSQQPGKQLPVTVSAVSLQENAAGGPRYTIGLSIGAEQIQLSTRLPLAVDEQLLIKAEDKRNLTLNRAPVPAQNAQASAALQRDSAGTSHTLQVSEIKPHVHLASANSLPKAGETLAGTVIESRRQAPVDTQASNRSGQEAARYTATIKTANQTLLVHSEKALQVEQKLTLRVVNAGQLQLVNNPAVTKAPDKAASADTYQPILKLAQGQAPIALAKPGQPLPGQAFQAIVESSRLLNPGQAVVEQRFSATLQVGTQSVEVSASRPLLVGQQLNLTLVDKDQIRYQEAAPGLPKSPALLTQPILQATGEGVAKALAAAIQAQHAGGQTTDAVKASGAERGNTRDATIEATVTRAELSKAGASVRSAMAMQFTLQLQVGTQTIDVLSAKALLPGQQLTLKVLGDKQLQLVDQSASVSRTAARGTGIVEVVSGSPQAIRQLNEQRGGVFQAVVLSSNMLSNTSRGLSSPALPSYVASLQTTNNEQLEVRGSRPLAKGETLDLRALDNHLLRVEASNTKTAATRVENQSFNIVKADERAQMLLSQLRGAPIKATVVDSRVNVENVGAKAVSYLSTLQIADQRVVVASRQALVAGQSLQLTQVSAKELQVHTPQPVARERHEVAGQSSLQTNGKPASAEQTGKTSSAQPQSTGPALVLKGPPAFIMTLASRQGEILTATVMDSRPASAADKTASTPTATPDTARDSIVRLKIADAELVIRSPERVSRGEVLSLRVVGSQQLQRVDNPAPSRDAPLPDTQTGRAVKAQNSEARERQSGRSEADVPRGLPKSPESLRQAPLTPGREAALELSKLASQRQTQLQATVIASRALEQQQNLERQLAGQKQRYEITLQIQQKTLVLSSEQAFKPGQQLTAQWQPANGQLLVQTATQNTLTAQAAQALVKGGVESGGYSQDITANLKQALRQVLAKQDSYQPFFQILSKVQTELGTTIQGRMQSALMQMLAVLPKPSQLQTLEGLRSAVQNSGIFYEARQRLQSTQTASASAALGTGSPKSPAGISPDNVQGVGRSGLGTASVPGAGESGQRADVSAATKVAATAEGKSSPGVAPTATSTDADGSKKAGSHQAALRASGSERYADVGQSTSKFLQDPKSSVAKAAAPAPLAIDKAAGQAVKTQSTSSSPVAAAELGEAASRMAGKDIKGNLMNLLVELHNASEERKSAFFQPFAPSQSPIEAIAPIQREHYDAFKAFFRFFLNQSALTASSKTATKAQASASVAEESDEESSQRIFRQLVSTVARTQLHQLNTLASQQGSVNDPVQLNSWTFELPVLNGAQVDIIEFRIDEELAAENEEGEKERVWKVMLSFDIAQLGTMYVQLKLVLESLSATFWSQTPQLLQLVEEEVSELKDNLTELGVTVKEVNYVEGKPPSTEVRLDQYLVDVET